MAFKKIPAPLGYSSVRYIENDESAIVSAESQVRFGSVIFTSNGAVGELTKISDEDTLAKFYGAPNDKNRSEWWNVARTFLYKTDGVNGTGVLTRVVGTGSLNQALGVTVSAVVEEANLTTNRIDNETQADNPTIVYDTAVDASDTRIKFFSKYPTDTDYKIALANPTDFATANIKTGVKFTDYLTEAPVGTEIAYALLDDEGTVIEVEIVDLTEGNVNSDNLNNYAEVAINERSSFLLAYVNTAITDIPFSFEATSMLKGTVVNPVKADYLDGLELFDSVKTVDINYMIPHSSNAVLTATDTITETDTLCKSRLDCRMIWGPGASVLVGKPILTAQSDILEYVNTTFNFTSTYSEFFGNCIFFYDKYAKKNVWGELSGDLVGLRILKNLTGNPWDSSAGLNDGQLRNVVKLAQDWGDKHLRSLQVAKINPVINIQGKGKFSWGVQNYTTKKSALIDSTTRELLIVIWRAMRESLQWDLFKTNDELTQGEITAKTEQFMEFTIEAGGGVNNTSGLAPWKVICNGTNNTAQVVDQGQLICEVKVVPSRITKEIVLVATVERTGTDLEEIA